MAYQAIPLGVRPFGASGFAPWQGAVRLDPAFTANGAVAFLRYVHPLAARIAINIGATADGSFSDGPDFAAAFEAAPAALTFSEAGGRSVVLAGPGAPGNLIPDPEQPYLWSPANQGAWVGWQTGLGGGEVTLTLDDGRHVDVPVAGSGILAAAGDRLLAGTAAAAQRLADALRIQRGTYPLLRDYGSNLGRIVDRRPAAIFEAVAEAVAHPPNGLGDVALRAVRVATDGAGNAVVDVEAEWRPGPPGTPTPISIRQSLEPAA